MNSFSKNYDGNMKRETVLITGSSKRLGEELALVFASTGYDIILHERDEEDLSRIQAEIIQTGVNYQISTGDLRLDTTIEELHQIATRENVSVLINNAGISQTSPDKKRDITLQLNEINDKSIDDKISTNLIAPIKLTKRLYSLFQSRGSGAVININSLAGLEPQELRSIYGASKWGLRGFTETFRLEAAKYGVRTMGVYPSRIRTKEYFTYGMDPKEVAEKIFTAYADTTIHDVVLDGRPGK